MKFDAERLLIRNGRLRAFCKSQHVELLIMFGSQAKDVTHTESDLDIAIQFENSTKSIDRLALGQKIEELIGNNITVDLVILRPETSVVLRNEIFSSGRVVYEQKKDVGLKEKWKAWTTFQDAKPLFNRHHRAYMKQFLKENHVS